MFRNLPGIVRLHFQYSCIYKNFRVAKKNVINRIFTEKDTKTIRLSNYPFFFSPNTINNLKTMSESNDDLICDACKNLDEPKIQCHKSDCQRQCCIHYCTVDLDASDETSFKFICNLCLQKNN